MPSNKHKTPGALVALLFALAALIAGCGGGDDTSSSTAAGGDTSSSTQNEPVDIAFLAGIVANPYTQATAEGMEELAAEENASITVIDSQFDPEKQYSQFESLIAAGGYDGIVVLPLNGTALKPLVQRAVDAGIQIGATDLPLGPDNTTIDVQAEGLAVTVLRPFSVHGENLGKLTVEACEGIDPCRVAFMYGVKASPFDQQLFKSFEQVVSASGSIEVVAELEGQYSREGGLAAAQNVIQAHDDLDVLVGADQSILGAEPALKAAGKEGEVTLVGYGGTKQAIAAVEADRWFGDSVSAPATEGKLVLGGVLDAIREGKTTGGLDAVVELEVPENGRIKADNADRFEPEYDG